MSFRRPYAALVAAAGLMVPGVCAHASTLTATLGFNISSAEPQPLFYFEDFNTSTDEPAPPNGTLSVAEDAEVDFEIDFGLGGIVYERADFDFSAELVDVNVSTLEGNDLVELVFDGAFSFSTGNAIEILSASFTAARMIFVLENGIVTHVTSLTDLDTVAYSAGPALPGDPLFIDPQEVSFSVLDLSRPDGGRIRFPTAEDGNPLIGDFVFSSGMDGTSGYVPEPGTLVLLGMGGCCLVRRGRAR